MSVPAWSLRNRFRFADDPAFQSRLADSRAPSGTGTAKVCQLSVSPEPDEVNTSSDPARGSGATRVEMAATAAAPAPAMASPRMPAPTRRRRCRAERGGVGPDGVADPATPRRSGRRRDQLIPMCVAPSAIEIRWFNRIVERDLYVAVTFPTPTAGNRTFRGHDGHPGWGPDRAGPGPLRRRTSCGSAPPAARWRWRRRPVRPAVRRGPSPPPGAPSPCPPGPAPRPCRVRR